MIQNLFNKKITILGAKRSGVSAARLLRKMNANVFISDRDKMTEERKSEFHSLGIEFESGGHTERVLDCDLCVVSPGVPNEIPIMQKLLQAKKEMISEIELGSWFCKAKMIAITGSEGKTTTTTLINEICQHDGAKKKYISEAIGNIGKPICDYATEFTENDVAAIETSSFQLEYCFSFKPKVAIITNLNPNHLDRYNNKFEEYAKAKYRIFQSQDDTDFMIYNYDNFVLQTQVASSTSIRSQSIPVSLHADEVNGYDTSAYLSKENELILNWKNKKEKIFSYNELEEKKQFIGTHNIYNSLFAIAACRAIGVDGHCIRETILNFKGVEHRLEFVVEKKGVRYYNDSKATSVYAMKSALETIHAPIVLIAGGKDKGNDYSDVLPLIKEKVSTLIAIGESKEKIISFFSPHLLKEQIIRASTMEEAVRLSSMHARKGTSVLLSPACASFDMFAGGFEERGEVFKKNVLKIV